MEISKAEIRKRILQARKTLSMNDQEEYSDIIFNQIREHKAYNDNSKILLYASYNNEVITYKALLMMIMDGKEVYMPKVNGKSMDFFRVFSTEDLLPGNMNIPEPLDIEDLKFDKNNRALMILPLSAFDRTGNRIGYGGGFYDRYLEDNSIIIKAGAAYSLQEFNNIPSEDTDIKLDYIFTEKEIIEVNND